MIRISAYKTNSKIERTLLLRGFFLVLFVCLFPGITYSSKDIIATQDQAVEDTVFVNELLKKAVLFQNVDLDSCYVLAGEALYLSQKLQYQNGIKRACIRLGSVMITKGYVDSAELFLIKAKDISKSIGDAKSIAGVSMLLAYVYQDKGMQESAFAALYESLAYSQKAKNELLTIQNYNALADLYSSYKDYSKALVLYQKALQRATLSNFEDEAQTSLMGIGSVYYQMQKFEQALGFYLQADSLGKIIGSTISIAQNLNNIALCYADLKLVSKALRYYELAITAYKEQGMQREEANGYYNIGCLYFDHNQSDKAINYLNLAVSLFNITGEVQKIAECYELLAKAHAKKGDFIKAYRFYEQYTSLSDSLMNSEKIRSISEMQIKYETELKTTEIKILQRENDIAKLKASRSLGINFGLGGALVGIVFVAFAFYNQSKKKQKLNADLTIEKKKSDDLLLNILPSEIAEELKQSGVAKAKQYNHVTVLFTDCVNFTGISEQMSPTELVEEINKNFTAFDGIMEQYGLEKIKTIGDAYLAVCGLPNETEDHAQRVVKAAIAIQQFMTNNEGRFQIRIGIHTGSVVAGIVGVKKYAYDIWGDTVNTAARMEQHSEAGKINISGTTYELIKDAFVCEHRGKIKAKNKGEVDMYFVKH